MEETEEHKYKEFFEKVNEAFKDLRDYRKEWKEELKKRKLFENTLMDGLEIDECNITQ